MVLFIYTVYYRKIAVYRAQRVRGRGGHGAPLGEDQQDRGLDQLLYICNTQYSSHRRRIHTEEKAKVIAAAWGTYCTWICSSKDDLKKSFWKDIHFGRVVVWCGLSWKIIQLFRRIHSAKWPFFYSSISSNHPVVRQGIGSFLSPKQRRRSLPLLLYKSCFYDSTSLM